MILENHYSHASDVWAFGILAWELYTSFAVGQNDILASLPYHNIGSDKVNVYMYVYITVFTIIFTNVAARIDGSVNVHFISTYWARFLFPPARKASDNYI